MYRGHVGLHNYRKSEPEIPHRPGVLQLARWLPHRFCGVEAEMEGRFTIPTVKRGRDALRLNYRCRPGGHIQVELISTVPSRIHPDADPIPGYSFADCDLLSRRSPGPAGVVARQHRPERGRRPDRGALADVPGEGVRVFGLSSPIVLGLTARSQLSARRASAAPRPSRGSGCLRGGRSRPNPRPGAGVARPVDRASARRRRPARRPRPYPRGLHCPCRSGRRASSASDRSSRLSPDASAPSRLRAP